MNNSIRKYLDELKLALKGADPAIIQDALWDAESHLKSGLSAILEKRTDLSEADAIEKIIESFGTPGEVAQAYLEREIVVQSVLRPELPSQQKESDDSSKALSAWPSFFGIFKTPKAYTSLLYLLVSLPVGIFFFVWAVTGISLSFGLLILIIGIPFALAFVGTVRILALAEGRIVEALLDVRMPRRPTLLPQGKGVIEKLKSLLGDVHTWSSLAYLILHLPLGIFYFVTMVVGLSVSFSLIFAPFAKLFLATGVFFMINGASVAPPLLALFFAPVVGVLLLVATLHAAFALGRLHGLIAKYMLVQR